MLSEQEYNLVRVAFRSMMDGDSNGDATTIESGLVSLDTMRATMDVSEHPRVKEGSMAPTKARDTLNTQFDLCAREHNGYVTFDEFARYHEKLADEAFDEQTSNVPRFIEDTIMRLWRLGDLLMPTGIRPAFPVQDKPRGLFAANNMALVWVEEDPADSTRYVLKAIKDVVRPIFSRGDLPEELQGLFAYPQELAGQKVQYVSTQVSIQRWLDLVWEYDEGKFCGLEGIVSARVDRDVLPPALSQLIIEHSEAARRSPQWVKTSVTANPMYKRSNDAYGYGVHEECKRIHNWKLLSLTGKQYGNQYYGLVGKEFSRRKKEKMQTAATGMNI